MDKPISRP